MGIQDITAVPQTPAHVKGVINLRGKVIPVVDLRLKFGLPEQEYTQRTCIIVVQVRGEAGPMLMGIVVDGVAEVLNLAAADIEDTPDFGDGTATPYLLGMAKVKGKVKILLEIDRVLTSQDLRRAERSDEVKRSQEKAKEINSMISQMTIGKKLFLSFGGATGSDAAG